MGLVGHGQPVGQPVAVNRRGRGDRMTWTAARGAALCLLLGIADLAVINGALGPALWPASEASPASEKRRAGDPVSGAIGGPVPVARAPDPGPAPRPDQAGRLDAGSLDAASAAMDQATPIPRADLRAFSRDHRMRPPDQRIPPTVKPPEPRPARIPVPDPLIVLFKTTSAALDAQARRDLDALTGALRTRSDLRILVFGHTDHRGEQAFNQRLGQARAESIAGYLAARGISRSRITVKSLGSSQPRDRGDTPEAWARNRRAEVSFSLEEAQP